MSFALCVAVAGLWVWGHLQPRMWSRAHYVPARNEMRQFALYSNRGWLASVSARHSLAPLVVERVEEREKDVHLISPNLGPIYFPKGWVVEDLQPGAADLPDPEHWWERFGVYVRIPRDEVGGLSVAVVVPNWFLLSLFSIAPLVWVAKWWRRRTRVANGKCRNCGYDMRASPGRCPECGMATIGAEVSAGGEK
jgi:hypothetical protein